MQTQHFAVVGNPIEHSLSPTIHRLFGESTDLDVHYQKERVDLSEFESWVDHFFASGGVGLNVTVPFKLRAFQLARHRSPRAIKACAANTLGINQAGEIWADNTDGIGLVRDITQHQFSLKDTSIVILGAGGAVRGVMGTLLEQAPRCILIANRTLSKAQAIVNALDDDRLSATSLDDIGTLQPVDWVISGLSSGLDGQLPKIPDTLVGTNTRVYDMIYGTHDTAFIQWAKQQGAATTLDGLGMLIEQAAESFFLWHTTRPSTQGMIETVRGMLK